MLITVTGPSGSGKSYISNYLCSLNKNIVHLNIDEVGHKVLELLDVKNEISKKFNLGLIDNKIDRKQLGELVFNNQEKMEMLSEITWKKMEEEIDDFIKINKDKIIILDWILIPKTKYFKNSNINILITSDFSTRMRRAIKRDKITTDKFKEREKATLEFNENNFDFVIKNNNLEDTKRMVLDIYEQSIISR